MNTLQTLEERQNDLINQDITADIYSQFINYLDAKPATVATYTRALRQFAAFMAENEIVRPTRADIIAYRDELIRDKKPATVQTYIIALRLFFGWLEQSGIYPNIAEHIKGCKIDKEHKKDNLTTAQAQALFKGIDTATINGKRDYAIIATMITGGLRDIEIARANIEDLRTLGDETVLYIQGKGRDEKTEYIKITAAAYSAIQAYLKERGKTTPSAPLFASLNHATIGERLTTKSISRIVKTHLINAGLNSDRLTAHSLRHTAATLNLLNGGTLEETQQLLRHTNINTTMIYLHHINRANNKSEERISAAIFG
ncbi:MAG: site-specific integrase [Treponemataceae bacterium]|nr:site-specific integrase [Treponemataceae bacterium]